MGDHDHDQGAGRTPAGVPSVLNGHRPERRTIRVAITPHAGDEPHWAFGFVEGAVRPGALSERILVIAVRLLGNRVLYGERRDVYLWGGDWTDEGERAATFIDEAAYLEADYRRMGIHQQAAWERHYAGKDVKAVIAAALFGQVPLHLLWEDEEEEGPQPA